MLVAPKSQTPIPGDEKTEEGSFNSISCRGEGKPPPKVHWQKYGANITGDVVIEITYNRGITNDQRITTIESQLKFNGIRYTDSASYSCIIYNSTGKVNLTAKREVECKSHELFVVERDNTPVRCLIAQVKTWPVSTAKHCCKVKKISRIVVITYC